jgi:hypothetical protein
LRRRHRRRRLRLPQSSSSLSSVAPSPVAIVVLVVASRHRCRHPILSCRHPSRHRCRRPSRRHHHCLRINTVTPHFSLGIPISVWGSPNQNGDPQTDMGINTSPYQNGDPRIGLGIVQSLTRIGLGFVPIWDFRVSSPNWNGIQNGDPILERGSPYGTGNPRIGFQIGESQNRFGVHSNLGTNIHRKVRHA